MKYLIQTILFLFTSSVFASFSGAELLNGKNIVIDSSKKVNVVFFTSMDCPCSDSHMAHIKKLSKAFKSFNFIGFNINEDKPLEELREYYASKGLEKVIFRDQGLKMADKLSAVKTPHTFVLDEKGKVLFHGGITNSSTFENSTKFYLLEVLTDLKNGKTPRRKFARALGCYIPR